MKVEQARADDPLYRNYVRAIDDLIQSSKEEKKQSKRPPKQKAPKPFEQSLRDYPVSPKTPSETS